MTDDPPPPTVARSSRHEPQERIARILRTTALLAGVAALLWTIDDAVLVIFLAVLLATMLRGLGRQLHRVTGLNITAAVIITFAILVAIIGSIGSWVSPRLVAQTHQLWGELSGHLHVWWSKMNDLDFAGLSGGAGGTSLIRLVASSTISFLGALVVVTATAVYLAIDPEIYVEGVVHLLPIWYRQKGRSVLIEMGAAMQDWLLGQFVNMIAIGLLVGGGLALLGVPLALVLGVVAGLFTFVPYLGTIISAIPALLVAFTAGLRETLWVIGLFLVAHGVEGYLIAPLVQRRTVRLPPALTVTAMIVLTAIFGMTGVLIATPLVAVVMIGTARIYVEDILGDSGAGDRLRCRVRSSC